MLLQLGLDGSALEILEAVDEAERVWIEDGELLLDSHGEVGRRLELLAGVPELLVWAQALGVAHGAVTVVKRREAGPRARDSTSGGSRARAAGRPPD